jgi:hypothetical protein
MRAYAYICCRYCECMCIRDMIIIVSLSLRVNAGGGNVFPLFYFGSRPHNTRDLLTQAYIGIYFIIYTYTYHTSCISRSDEFFSFLYVTRACVCWVCVCVLGKHAKERTTTRIYLESYYIIYVYVLRCAAKYIETNIGIYIYILCIILHIIIKIYYMLTRAAPFRTIFYSDAFYQFCRRIIKICYYIHPCTDLYIWTHIILHSIIISVHYVILYSTPMNYTVWKVSLKTVISLFLLLTRID